MGEASRGGAWAWGAPRRMVVAVLFAVLGMWLARVVAGDQPWVGETLRGIGETLPGFVEDWGLGPGVAALALLGGLLVLAAVGAFMLSSESGAVFGMLVAGVVAWFVVPYAQMPWALLLTGQEVEVAKAPGSVWWLAGGLVLLGTVEMVASARGALLSSLREHGFQAGEWLVAVGASRRRLGEVVLGVLVVGGGVVVAYRWLLEEGVFAWPVADLLWVPVVVGLIVGGVLWWSARRGLAR